MSDFGLFDLSRLPAELIHWLSEQTSADKLGKGQMVGRIDCDSGSKAARSKFSVDLSGEVLRWIQSSLN